MKKRRRRAWPLGQAVLTSIVAAFGIALALTIALYAIFPRGPVHMLFDIVQANHTSTIERSPIYQDFLNRVDNLQEFLVSPLSMFICGLTLGGLVGEEYGQRVLYRWSAGAAGAMNLICLVFLWGFKLMSQGFRLTKYDLPPSLIVAQIFSLIFWIGMSVIGAEVGRRFWKRRTQTE